MKLRESEQGISFGISPRVIAPFAAVALFGVVASIASCSGSKRVEAAKQGQKESFVRVEDLPVATQPGFVRVDELASAAPVAVRPLKPKELTPELIRRADDLLRKDRGKLGTQVLVEVGDKAYIARFEWHYQYDQASDRQERWHKGITLYTTE
jgi:hypothetical protein